MKPRFNKLVIKDIRKETEDAVSIELLIPEGLETAYTYKAGQHLNFKAIIDGEEVRRSYSICTGEQDNELRVAIKQQPFGKFSTYANTELMVGDEVEVMTPSGVFTNDIEENEEKSYLFYAGGSGITPILSHVKTILHKSPKSDVTVVYGNRGFNHIIFREELDDLKNNHMENFALVHVFNEERIGNPLQEGLLNKEKIGEIQKSLFADLNFDKVFVCGPEPMIFAVKDAYEEIGYDPKQIHFELFTSPDDDKKKTGGAVVESKIEANVKIILDGEETLLNINGDINVLDAAIEAGVDAPYSCKGGVCSTCKGKVIEGEAVMDKNYALEEDEVNAGYILTCQAHPVSDKLVVSYDD